MSFMPTLLRFDGVLETILWSYRSWARGYYIPTDWYSWTPSNFEVADDRENTAVNERIKRIWHSLAPFFFTKGYSLYEFGYPSSKPGPSAPSSAIAYKGYPWPRKLPWCSDNECWFRAYHSMRVWAARDEQGREVIIRLVSTPEVESDELKIYQRLNTLQARSDPRAHRVIPVLEYIKYDGLTFIVLPRWGKCFNSKFDSVEQLLVLADHLFEGLAYLHDLRIVHRDITWQNAVINALYNPLFDRGRSPDCMSIIRKVDEAQYAFIDYDASLIFPLDTEIDTIIMDRLDYYGARCAGVFEGQGNPFKDDIVTLGFCLQRYVRVIENVVPEIGVFFDSILTDKENPPSAAACHAHLRTIRSSLTSDQLNTPPQGQCWDFEDGRVSIQPYMVPRPVKREETVTVIQR